MLMIQHWIHLLSKALWAGRGRGERRKVVVVVEGRDQ